MKSLITIIIPTYNRIKFIDDAINSVLNQSYKNIEIIIIDDGSTYKAKEYIKEKYSNNELIRIYENKVNSGAGYSRKVRLY